MSFLGLDIGTSGVKAVVIDDAGLQVAQALAPLSSFHPHSGWSEQDPNDWVKAVIECCSALQQSLGSAWQGVQAIGLSGQMHGATLLDEAKQPVRPAILWNDGRSADQCEVINQTVKDIEIKAGILAMPGFTSPKVLWCAQNESVIHGRIAHILLPKDYVRLALTGELVTDMADAAGTLWLDQEKRDWDDELCSVSQTDPNWLPTLMEGTQVSGNLRPQIASKLGLSAGIPVAGGGGDAAAGALGIGAIEDGDAFISLGTSGQLFVTTNSYKPAPDTAIHCYAHCVSQRWFQMACMLNGASPMNWFAALANKPIAELLEQAQTADKAPLFLPYLTGERTPHNDPKIRGTFYGLEPDTNDAQSMRGVVEAIAYSFCDANDSLNKAGTHLQTVATIGGGTQSDFVLQTMADAMSINIHRYEGSTTGPALGAARLAMVASGLHDLKEVAKKPQIDQKFEPRKESETYHVDKLSRWRELYQVLKPFAAS